MGSAAALLNANSVPGSCLQRRQPTKLATNGAPSELNAAFVIIIIIKRFLKNSLLGTNGAPKITLSVFFKSSRTKNIKTKTTIPYNTSHTTWCSVNTAGAGSAADLCVPKTAIILRLLQSHTGCVFLPNLTNIHLLKVSQQLLHNLPPLPAPPGYLQRSLGCLAQRARCWPLHAPARAAQGAPRGLKASPLSFPTALIYCGSLQVPEGESERGWAGVPVTQERAGKGCGTIPAMALQRSKNR